MNPVVSDPHRSQSSESPFRLICLSAAPAEPDAWSEHEIADAPQFASRGDKGSCASEAPISDAMAPLRDIVASLNRAQGGDFPSGGERQRLLRRARRAGLAVLPCLLRALAAPSDTEAAWAHCLLRAVAETEGRVSGGLSGKTLRERVLKRLNQLLASPRPADLVKARVLALLADLGAPLGEKVVLHDPDALLAGSVRELLANLDDPQELRQALELIFTQVPTGELRMFLDEVAHHGGAQARPLLAALITDPRLPTELAHHLMAQYRPTHQPGDAVPRSAARRPRSARQRLGTRLGRALALLGEGKLPQARARLTRLLPEFADQPAVHSALGLCLLRLGEPQNALAPLQRALDLEPAVAAHAWNLASAAHAAQELSACYHSLRRYLEQRDDLEGAIGRRRTAESFCRSYEQKAPGASAEPLLAPVLAQAGAGEE